MLLVSAKQMITNLALIVNVVIEPKCVGFTGKTFNMVKIRHFLLYSFEIYPLYETTHFFAFTLYGQKYVDM